MFFSGLSASLRMMTMRWFFSRRVGLAIVARCGWCCCFVVPTSQWILNTLQSWCLLGLPRSFHGKTKMNHSLRLSKSRLTSRPYGTDGLRMWSGPILGLLCGTPTYRSWFPQDNNRSICCKVHRLEPHPLDNYHVPYKNCQGYKPHQTQPYPNVGGSLGSVPGYPTGAPGDSSMLADCLVGCIAKRFQALARGEQSGARIKRRQVMCHDVSPKAGFSSDFRFSGGMCLWSKNSAMMTLIFLTLHDPRKEQFSMTSRTSMGENSKRHLETADRTKLRFLRTGVRRRGSEPMAHHGDFRLDPKPSNDLWDRSPLGLFNHECCFVFVSDK